MKSYDIQRVTHTPGKADSSLALVRTKYNDVFLFLFVLSFLGGVVRFHTALFAS